VGHATEVGEVINGHESIGGKPKGKSPLGRRRHRWEDNIKMDPKEIGCDYAD
jgi:hypothetical protein